MQYKDKCRHPIRQIGATVVNTSNAEEHTTVLTARHRCVQKGHCLSLAQGAWGEIYSVAVYVWGR